ncbi:anthranilate synthase component I [Helicobacter pylori]|nr:anthranilate synthase component I [Helicobacter pylori]WJX97803.1 anthranilate synthase component I [Helicobacter pylori]
MKALEIESEANKPLLMAQVCLKPNDHNIATTTSLTLNSGAFL